MSHKRVFSKASHKYQDVLGVCVGVPFFAGVGCMMLKFKLSSSQFV